MLLAHGMMSVIKLVLAVVHLAALAHFALKYLQFDVRNHRLESTSSVLTKIIESISVTQELSSTTEEVSEMSPVYDRFVYFLLDAWRWDFLFNERTEMKYLKSKIMKGEAVGLVSLARIPTVTKPCLKSIFAGTHPVFFEIVENIDESGVTETMTSSTATTQDNLLRRLHRQGKKISVYGDDVWGKLFPMSTFHRHNLAFGFNIMDYTSVDNLVHEGFEGEKASPIDSDVIILHYLGLDHIGHSYAAKSEYVDPKLREMDSKIQEVYDWVVQKDSADGRKTLILMMGDHGMTRDGNHGGGSKDEAQAAAVFISPHFKGVEGFVDWKEAIRAAEGDFHNQEDISATLTALLDSSSPPLKFGNGCLIKRVIQATPNVPERRLLLKNLVHLLERSSVTGNAHEVEKLFTVPPGQLTSEGIYDLSVEIKNILNSKSFSFDESKLKFAIGLLCLVTAAYSFLWFKEALFNNLETLLTIISVLIISACQSATSFLGEEHLLWQGAFLAALLVWSLKSWKTSAFRIVKVSVMHRILCGWNAVGTVWVNEKTLGTFIKSHDMIEGISVAIALVWIIKQGRGGFKSRFAQIFASILILFHRIGSKQLLFIQNYQLAQTILLVLVSDLILSKDKNLETCAALLFVLVNKPVNAIPVALILSLAHEIKSLESILRPSCAFLRLCLMQCSFYYLGLWNSVSAIDLTFGAVFTKAFDMKIAPVVLLAYSWSGPILVALVLNRGSRIRYVEVAFIRSILDTSACAFAYHHRFHGWIFDFFSPKILFQVFWALFYSLLLPLLFK